MRQSVPKRVVEGGESKWDTSGVLLDVAGAGAPLDWAAVFGNGRPVELEIGSGKGTFVLTRGCQRPEVNLVGVEYARGYCHYAADRLRRAGLGNVRMVHDEAGHFVREWVAVASLQRVHIYFPDPWPKRRHHRRRLIQPAFVDLVRSRLCMGGQLLIVTDHLGYFEHIRRVMYHARGLARVPLPRLTDRDGEVVGTNFERKYMQQSRPFYRLARLRFL